MTTFPQYAKTSHPDVIAAIGKTYQSRDEFLNKLRDLSQKYTGSTEGAVFSDQGWRFESRMIGFAREKVAVEDLPGKWKKPTGIALEPYANNPIRDEFPTHKAEHIPGRGNLFLGEGRMGSGTLFAHDGTAYSRIGFKADDNGEDHEAYGWIEIMPSEYHKALEDERAKREVEAKS